MDVLRDRKFLLTLAAIILLAALTYLFYWQFEGVRGKAYLTLAESGTHLPQLYSYDLKTGGLDPIGANVFEITSALSADGKKRAYVGHAGAPAFLQLKVNDRVSGNDAVITKSKTYFKRLPDWSPDGSRIAFMARQDSATSTRISPNQWTIYVTDLEGSEKAVAAGAYPKWSPDGGKLVFLKDDGLYILDFSSQPYKAKKVWDGKALLTMKVSLSPDRTKLSWTNVRNGNVYIFDVDFKNQRLGYPKIINANAFWAVFSPDNEYLLLQEVDSMEDVSRPRLTLYRLSDGNMREILDLDEYDNGELFLTEWR